MSWRRATCKCCATDCVLEFVEKTCTLVGDGPCPPIDCDTCTEPCDSSASITFGLPDLVSGRTSVDDVESYPDNEELFRWKGGSRLSIFALKRSLTCDGVDFHINQMSVTWGCPGTPEYKTVVFPSGYAVIDLPTDCTGCIIRIRLHYWELSGTDCIECATNSWPAYPLVATFDSPLTFSPLEDLNPGNSCGAVWGPTAETLAEIGRNCLDQASAQLLQTHPLQGSCSAGQYGAGFFTDPENALGVPVGSEVQCRDETDPGPPQRFLQAEAECEYVLGISLVIDDVGEIANGKLVGHVELVARVQGITLVNLTGNPPFTDLHCHRIGQEGTLNGVQRFPAVGSALLGNFNPSSPGSYCVAVLDALRNRGPYTVPGQGSDNSLIVTIQ